MWPYFLKIIEDVVSFNGEKFKIEKSLDWINSRFLFCTRSAIF